MPNHCMNQVVLACPSETVARSIKTYLEGNKECFDFKVLLPEPPEILKTTHSTLSSEQLRKKYGSNNWYDWRLRKWGTKWNAYHSELDDSQIKHGVLDYRFDTAWTPPRGVCRALLDYIEDNYLGIQVNWFYEESMMELQGQLEEEV